MAFDSRKWKRWLASAVGVLAVVGVMGSCGGRAVPTVVGAELPQAVQTLKDSGFAEVAVSDDQGAAITKPHYGDGYTVTAQDPSGAKASTSTVVKMTVTRTVPAPAPSPSPTRTTRAPASSPTPSPKRATSAPEPPPTPRATTPEPEPTVQEPAPAQAPASVYYANCSEARAAGAAPLYQGDPGYRPGLDRDKDGIACER